MKHKFEIPNLFTRALLGLLIASSVTAVAAQGNGAVAADAVVARLGSVTVGQGEIERLLQGLPEAERAAAKGNRAGLEDWLRQRLATEALQREAQSKGWASRPEIKARIDATTREITARIVSSTYLESVAQLPANYPSDADIAAAYEKARPGLALPATYRVSQIFLALPEGADAAAVTKVRDEARKLAVQARQGDFAALARSRSQDARSAGRGGDVGVLPLAQMLPETREPVSKLKAGQVSDPVQTEAGFHILKLAETQPARTATLDEVKPRLRQALREQRQQELVRDYMAGLAPASGVSIDSAALESALQKVN